MTQTITVIRGDGIGPEIMDATLSVLDTMQLGLVYEEADAGLVALRMKGAVELGGNCLAVGRAVSQAIGEGGKKLFVGTHQIPVLLEQIPAKLNDFADKDLLQHFDLARVLFGGMIPSRRDAR